MGHLRRYALAPARSAVRLSARLFCSIMCSCTEYVHREVVGQILDEMPPDPTDKEDMVYAALLQGRPGEALAAAAELDIWLATHFADLMEAAELIESETDECVTLLCSFFP